MSRLLRFGISLDLVTRLSYFKGGGVPEDTRGLKEEE
jgi:hypothetical protein